MIYPNADIPSLQLSLIQGLDPAEHIALGKALSDIMKENVLVLGSGFSFHNMREFHIQNGNRPDPKNDAFQDWLIGICTENKGQSEREQHLVEWEKAPSAAQFGCQWRGGSKAILVGPAFPFRPCAQEMPPLR